MARCCAALDWTELATDPRFDTEARRVTNRDALIPLLNEILGARTAEEWLKRFESAGVPAGRIKSVPEVCESLHLKARKMIATLPHPRAGRVTVLGVPIRLHTTPGRVRLAPPLLGQHTDAVLRTLAGLGKKEVARLRAQGVV